MSLFDLVKQHDTVRLSADSFGQLAAFLVSHISRRCSDQSGYGVFLHILAHIDPDHILFVVKEGFGQCLGKLGLADAGRTKKQEGADGFGRILDAGLGSEDRIRNQPDAFVLPDDPFVQLILEFQQLGSLALGQPCHRDAGPSGNDPCDLVLGDRFVHQASVSFAYALFLVFQFFLKLRQFSVLQLCRLFQIVSLLGHLDLFVDIFDLLTDLLQPLDRMLLVIPLSFLAVEGVPHFRQFLLKICKAFFTEIVCLFFKSGLFDLQLHDLASLLIQFGRHGIQLRLDQSTGLVHQIDSLVRKEPV